MIKLKLKLIRNYWKVDKGWFKNFVDFSLKEVQ